jgi:hypothetical protein
MALRHLLQRPLQALPESPRLPGGIRVQGLNNLGQIAAVVIDDAGSLHGFVGTDKHFTIFDYPDPDATAVIPLMLNDFGVTVGTYTLSDGNDHAFKLEADQFINVDPPGATYAQAAGVNNRGVIVGAYINILSQVQGFMREGTQCTDFKVPNAVFTLPSFINDRGQISGIYVDANFASHGFVATPVTGG